MRFIILHKQHTHTHTHIHTRKMNTSTDPTEECYCLRKSKDTYHLVFGGGDTGDSLINSQYSDAIEYVKTVPKSSTITTLEHAISMRDKLLNFCPNQAKYHCIVVLLRFRLSNMQKND
jgi:hypothetical protein